MVEIVVAGEEHKDKLWQLFLEYAQELSTYDGEKRPAGHRHYPDFDLYWTDKDRIPFVILYDHEPIGFCFLHDVGISYRIDEFYIRPLHRRRGFGRLAVEHVKDYCRNLGRHKTLAADIYVNNRPAVDFWQSVGFVDTGRRVRIKDLRLIEAELDLQSKR